MGLRGCPPSESRVRYFAGFIYLNQTKIPFGEQHDKTAGNYDFTQIYYRLLTEKVGYKQNVAVATILGSGSF
jgi:hypothetical protein